MKTQVKFTRSEQVGTDKPTIGEGMVVVIRGNLYKRTLNHALRHGVPPRKALEELLNKHLTPFTDYVDAIANGDFTYAPTVRRLKRWDAGE